MIGHQLALLKREILEHRSIYTVPAIIGIILSLLTLTGQVTVSAFGDFVDLAVVGASNVHMGHRRAMLTGAFSVTTMIFAIGAWLVMVFYCLDTLYAERKDKSILFWRSLPITDAETVVSKLLIAIIVIPGAFLVTAFATHLIMLILSSLWVIAEGGNAGHLIWTPAPIVDNWSAFALIAIAMTLWWSPFLGWFLFVSAFAKRSPFMIAFLPIIVLPMIEKLLPLKTDLLLHALFVRTFEPPLFNVDISVIQEEGIMPLDPESVSLLATLDLGGFLSDPSLYAGIIVCGILTVGAIYVRRYRDDS
jgi:ABC-2 type transport system permease protein